MQETDLVMKLIEELSHRQCNGHAKVRLGTALADPEKFRDIFHHYSRGTYFEEVDLDLEVVYPEVQCACGYRAAVTSPDMLSAACPQCGGDPQLQRGTEFEIIEPEE
jgi:Zn finger protein HypA/HybF involved in hydrogenase expression